jgi:hypothetical protein
MLPFSKPVNVDEKEGIGCEELSWESDLGSNLQASF